MTLATRASRIVTACLTLTLAACASTHSTAPETAPNTDDPLIGRIFQHSGSAPLEIEHADFLQRLAAADVIYLGEDHDNVQQHAIQRDSVRKLAEMGRQPSVGFEFFARADTPWLNAHNASPDKHHERKNDQPSHAERLLRKQLGWDENREDDWQHLYPIVQLTREFKLPVFGADINAGLRRQVSMLGYAGLNAVEKSLTPLSDFDDEGYKLLMMERFKQAHCGWGDPAYLQRLYDAWLARNQAMADSIVAMKSQYPDQPVVVILGGGHTEYGLGVVERVAKQNPELKQINLRLTTVASAPYPVDDYFEPLLRDGRDFGVEFEYRWFTAPVPDREDMCAAFLKHKGKSAHGGDATTAPAKAE